MIKEKDYLKAKKIVEQYETQQFNKPVVMRRFLIRVIKAKKKTYWYSDEIGNKFKVAEHADKENYYQCDHPSHLFDKKDVEVLKTFA